MSQIVTDPHYNYKCSVTLNIANELSFGIVDTDLLKEIQYQSQFENISSTTLFDSLHHARK